MTDYEKVEKMVMLINKMIQNISTKELIDHVNNYKMLSKLSDAERLVLDLSLKEIEKRRTIK